MAYTADEEEQQHGASAPGRVLLVDDQPELRRLLRRSLIKAGHVVVEAANGRVAVGLAQQLRFDVVISDVTMPDMSGVELLEALRELDPDLPVVLTSGFPEASASLEAFAYLEKPVPFETVCATAARAIRLRRARSARESFVPCASVERLRIPNPDDDEHDH
jgi:two-component system chemotaxis response regulator CheY